MNRPTKKIRKIADDKIKDRFWTALNLLFKNDTFLLKEEAHERSITHKLAEYLQHQFLGWHVDCEYNRHGIDKKTLPRECNDKHEENVYPDIIAHHRNTDHNLLVVEIKLNKSKTVDKCDNAKLIEFTKSNGDYKYQLGLFIGFDRLNEPQIVWYKNGQQTLVVEQSSLRGKKKKLEKENE